MAEVAQAIGEGPRVALGKEPTKIQLETRSELLDKEDIQVEKSGGEPNYTISSVSEGEVSPALKKPKMELQKTLHRSTVHIRHDLPGPSSAMNAMMTSTGLMLGQVVKGVMVNRHVGQ